uniref:Uncharacterized protein n=1 Tax=Craspedostauros australis TaxID=1486917 RepID=A0A7R9ZT69_9STRA|eukprot:CAMPEP_0198128454 /NCGR_PEP_ID=MMETSP1442-20131203/49409_1 /TAXON_ID= /ORGANISM="Craspedostauros australis, Strain CCMP3328" /LENGTH=161 /DNA_ID=CAMNT_0043788617 /DNA_START=38 /DNA_END=523 /DNA_ORIENTATION=+
MSCAPILSPHTPLRVREVCGPWLLLEHSQQACLRMHRNTVFVIERKNLVDETINLALLPADVFLSTPIGQTTWQVARPMVVAGRQLLMPALLSAKLFWMAARTTMLASFTGVTAASTAMWNEGSTQLTTDEYDDAPPAAASNLQIVPAASAVAPNYKFISL